MKSFVALIFAVGLVEFASSVSIAHHDRVIAAKNKCAKEHNIEDSVIQEFISKKKLPETEQGKCMVACYLEEMKLLVNGKAVLEEWKNTNKERWEDPEIVAKADEVAKKCNDDVPSDGKNKCQYSVDLLKCVMETSFKEGIPKPDLKNPTRR